MMLVVPTVRLVIVKRNEPFASRAGVVSTARAGGGGAAFTVIVPVMLEMSESRYGKLPGVSNDSVAVSSKSKTPVVNKAVVLVASWKKKSSLFTHVTVSPATTVSELGEYVQPEVM